MSALYVITVNSINIRSAYKLNLRFPCQARTKYYGTWTKAHKFVSQFKNQLAFSPKEPNKNSECDKSPAQLLKTQMHTLLIGSEKLLYEAVSQCRGSINDSHSRVSDTHKY